MLADLGVGGRIVKKPTAVVGEKLSSKSRMNMATTSIQGQRKGGIAAKIVVIVIIVLLGLFAAWVLLGDGTHRVRLVAKGEASVDLYTALGRDCGIVGFVIERKSVRQPAYFPISANVDRSIPDEVLTVIVSKNANEIWVQTDRGRVFGYLDIDRNLCITQYGAQAPCERPIPHDLGPGMEAIPAIVPSDVGRTMTVTMSYDGRWLEMEDE